MDPMATLGAALGVLVAEAAALEALDTIDALDTEGRLVTTGEVAVAETDGGIMPVKVPDGVDVGRSVEASLIVRRLYYVCQSTVWSQNPHILLTKW